VSGCPPRPALPNHVHRFDPLQCPPRRRERAVALRQPGPCRREDIGDTSGRKEQSPRPEVPAFEGIGRGDRHGLHTLTDPCADFAMERMFTPGADVRCD
jgi:hypothetical protein